MRMDLAVDLTRLVLEKLLDDVFAEMSVRLAVLQVTDFCR